jgi:hypothetical protein
MSCSVRRHDGREPPRELCVPDRPVHVMASRRTSDFGDTRLFKAFQLQQALHSRGR